MREKSLDAVPLLPDNAAASSIGKLWLQSRLKGHPKRGTLSEKPVEPSEACTYAPNQCRPLTVYHIRLAWQLAQLCVPFFVRLLLQTHRLAFLSALVTSVLSGLLPPLLAWSSAKLLLEVQHSLATGFVRIDSVKLYAGITIGTSLFRLVFQYAEQASQHLLYRETRRLTRSILMKVRLRLDLGALLSPYHRDVIEAADCFACNGQAIDRHGSFTYAIDARSLLFGSEKVVKSLVVLVSSLLLLVSTVLQASQDGRIDTQLAVVFIAMLPAALGLVSTFQTHTDSMSWDPFLQRRRRNLEELVEFRHRKEVSLLHLDDWIISRWLAAVTAEDAQQPLMSYWNWMQQFSSVCGAVTVSTTFQAFLALGILPNAVTLASAALLQSLAQQCIDSLADLYRVGEDMYQCQFFLAAFVEAATNLGPVVRPIMPTDTPDMEPIIFRPTTGPIGTGMKLQAIDLSYKYPNASRHAVRNLNFTVEAGETIAIVGENGAGKTTLLHALTRLVDYEGQLLINDIDARLYDIPSLHTAIASIFQDFSKFPASLRENIGVGNLWKMDSKSALLKAVEDSGVQTFLHQLPNGLDTNLSTQPEAPLSDSAKTKLELLNPEMSLSGGQWQKVALARCFLKVPDCSLVLLDEPSSALDAKAENALFEKIESLAKDVDGKRCRTICFITHRFNTVRRADKIAVFKEGTISEFGTHRQLMDLNGTYAELYALQAAAFAE